MLVVSGETGCGKTTQLPQFIMEDMIERGERTGGGAATTPRPRPRLIPRSTFYQVGSYYHSA